MAERLGKAHVLQTEYDHEEPDYEDWMFLGDLHQAAGDATAARISYQRALQILRGRVNEAPALPDSTSVDSTPKAGPSEQLAPPLTSQVTLEILQARRRFEERF